MIAPNSRKLHPWITRIAKPKEPEMKENKAIMQDFHNKVYSRMSRLCYYVENPADYDEQPEEQILLDGEVH